MRCWNENRALSNLTVIVVDRVEGPPWQPAIGNQLLSHTFGRNFVGDGPFGKDVRHKLMEARVPWAEAADLIVNEVWGASEKVVSRCHILAELDTLRNFGPIDPDATGEMPIIVQMAHRHDRAYCVCGYPYCPRNQNVAEFGAKLVKGIFTHGASTSGAIASRANIAAYNTHCHSCNKVHEYRAMEFGHRDDNRKDEYCHECGHCTYHQEVYH
jgi:hypothetical protein